MTVVLPADRTHHETRVRLRCELGFVESVDGHRSHFLAGWPIDRVDRWAHQRGGHLE